MARIYVARTTGIGAFERHVVLKLILPERAEDPTAVQMFLDEARLAAMLNHQNVAQVFEVGEDARIHYLAMEYVHGQDLRAFLAKAGGLGLRVPVELGLTIVAGAAAGLHHAHERRAPDGSPLGIVHRDVSPSNIMIAYDGAVKMLDFGIAKAAQRSIETISGIIKGKFAYMSPEQCRGRDVDRRSDVFSLGIILYETTTQHRCFRADSDFDTMHRIVTGDVVKPSRLVPNYPAALEAIVMRALSVDPTQRYQSAGHLLEAIEAYSLHHRTPLSTMALGRFMREMFGEVPEPWLVARPEVVPVKSEGTISNTNNGDAAARALPRDPDARAPDMMPAAATLKMTAAGVDDEPRTARRPPGPGPAVPVPMPSLQSGRTLIDDPMATTEEENEAANWESARSYPVGSVPAVASAHTLPPDSVMTARAARESARSIPPPAVLARSSAPSFPHHPAYSSAEAAEAAAMAPTMIDGPLVSGSNPGAAAIVGGSAHAAQPFGGPNTGSGPSHSRVTPYPQALESPFDDGVKLRPSRRPIYIGLFLAAVGIILFFALRGGGDDRGGGTADEAVTDTAAGANAGLEPAPPPPPDPTPPPPAPTKPTDVKVVPDKVPEKVDPPPTPPAPAPPPPDDPGPTMMAVVIKSDPPGMEVFLGSKRVGKTPYKDSISRDDKSSTFVLRGDGYIDESVSVTHDGDFERTVTMERKRAVRGGSGGSSKNKTKLADRPPNNTTSNPNTANNTTPPTPKNPFANNKDKDKPPPPKDCKRKVAGKPIDPFDKRPICPD
jgi:serine/threonine protein kinase